MFLKLEEYKTFFKLFRIIDVFIEKNGAIRMYSKIFEEIVEIVHKDYAGCLDKKGWDQPTVYRETLKELEERNVLDDLQFTRLVQDYLLDVKDAHVFFRLSTNEQERSLQVGFSVRRHRDKLYVTSVEEETRLQRGFMIVALDGMTIPEVVKKYNRQLLTIIAEREKWEAVLPRFKEAEVMDHRGNKTHLALNHYPKKLVKSVYEMKKYNSQTLLLTLTDFMDLDAVTKMIKNHQEELAQANNLIIDVRTNRGGSDTAFLELLPYLFEEDTVDLNDEDDKMVTNCTERNVNLRIDMLKSALQSVEDEQTQKILGIFTRELERNKGQGFVELDFSDLGSNLSFCTLPGPKKVLVLTDVFCGSSGESFVEICKKSSKVTVLGRPTAGLNDYANLALMKWTSKFELWYPTSRDSRIDHDRGMSGRGVAPDIYIPWTPQHIKEDMDLKEATRILESESFLSNK